MTDHDKNKQALNTLSRSILAVHRSLLHFQKEIYESANDRKLSPHEFLHLTMTDPDFEWLKALSTMIVQIDEAVDDKERKTELAEIRVQAVAELRELFIDPSKNQEFKARIIQALEKNASIWMEIAELRKQL